MTIHWNIPADFYSSTKFVYNNNTGISANPFGNNLFSYNSANFMMLPMPIFNIPIPKFDFITTEYKAKTNNSSRLNTGFGNSIVNNALKYVGYNEKDGSYKLFTNGRSQAWCADFVSHVVKESCKETGKSLPYGFGSSSVEGLRTWGKNNQCYLETSNKANKKDVIKQNVKPGDVIIFKEGTSHTGIVKEVLADGTITTLEGNTSNKVAERKYSANDSSISGFVQLA